MCHFFNLSAIMTIFESVFYRHEGGGKSGQQRASCHLTDGKLFNSLQKGSQKITTYATNISQGENVR